MVGRLDGGLEETPRSGHSPEPGLSPGKAVDSLDPDGMDLPTCEVDFVWINSRPHPQRTAIILGECKDQGPTDPAEFRRDVENLRRVADALPRDRFNTFVLLTKLAPFAPEEILCARTLNDENRLRAILLTACELEPYHIYERSEQGAGHRRYASRPEDLARATFEMYFQKLGDTARVGQEA